MRQASKYIAGIFVGMLCADIKEEFIFVVVDVLLHVKIEMTKLETNHCYSKVQLINVITEKGMFTESIIKFSRIYFSVK